MKGTSTSLGNISLTVSIAGLIATEIALRQGLVAAKNIAAVVLNRPLKSFTFTTLGQLATIGRRAAVVKFGRLHLRGFIGWLFWSVVHIYFLIGLRNRFIVAFTWLWSYLTFQRGARLITDPERTPKE